jgi:hypothetical protein
MPHPTYTVPVHYSLTVLAQDSAVSEVTPMIVTVAVATVYRDLTSHQCLPVPSMALVNIRPQTWNNGLEEYIERVLCMSVVSRLHADWLVEVL